VTPKWQALGDEYPGVDVQVARVGGRLRIVGVRVQHDDGVTLQQLQIPIHRLEAHFNVEEQGVAVRMVLPEGGWPPPKPRELELDDKYFEKEGRSYPPKMYARVAMLYSRCVAGGVRPAPAIAEANGVPETTVRRWIREARRRGVLAPARTPGGMG
jgi:hypothetical protein